MEKNKLENIKNKKDKKGAAKRPMTVEESPYWTEAKKRDFMDKMAAKKKKDLAEEQISKKQEKEKDKKGAAKRPMTVEESPYWTEAKKRDFMDKMAAKKKKDSAKKEDDSGLVVEKKPIQHSDNLEFGKKETGEKEKLSENDLRLRKEEIYNENGQYVEEHVGSGQFEYRKTPEEKKKKISVEEGLSEEDLLERKKEIYDDQGFYSEDHVGSGQFEYRKDPESPKKTSEEKTEKSADDFPGHDNIFIVQENTKGKSDHGLTEDIKGGAINEAKTGEEENLSENDLRLRKEEQYNENGQYVEEHVGSGQFEHRKTPELSRKNKEDQPIKLIEYPEDPQKEKELVLKEDGFLVPVIKQPSVPEGRRTVNVASADEIAKSYAWRLAEEKVREMLHEPEREMTSGSRMKALLNNITAFFRHPVRFAKKAYLRAAEQGYLYKFYREALEEITNNQNLMLEIETSYAMGRPVQVNDPNLKRERHYEILDKVIEQYSNNIAELEEQGNGLLDQRANTAFQDLLSRHYLEGWDRQRFEEEQRGLINELKDQGVITDQDFIGASGRSLSEVQDGRMYASNLFQIAEEYRNHIESKINELSADRNLSPEQKKLIEDHVRSTIRLDINLGAKLSDLHNKRPADTLNAIERRVAQLQGLPIIGKIASNPGTAAVLGALGGSFLGRGVVKGSAALGLTAAGVVTGAWIPVLSAGAAAGVYGAVRRNLELKKDRGMHQRQRILGNEASDYRRKRMDRFEYDVRSTGDMLAQLEQIKDVGNFNQLSNDQKRDLAEMFARFKVELQRDYDYRINGGDNRTVDLISVGNKEEGEKYGTNLISKTDLKKELYQYLRQNGLIESERNALGDNNEFNVLFNGEVLSLDQNINQMDQQFDSYRRRSAATMGAIAGFSGALGTIAGQEITNWFRGGSAYTAIDSLRDAFGSKGKINQLDSSLVFSGTGTRLAQGLNRVKVNGQAMEIFLNSDGKTIDVAQSHLPKDWKINPSGTGLIHETVGGYKSEHIAEKSLFIGNQEISSVPGAQEIVVGGEKIQVFVDPNGKIDLTRTSKILPKDWSLSNDGATLIHEIKGSTKEKVYNDFSEFAKDLGYDNTQRVSYQGFKFQGTAPDKGVRAMPEVIANLKNNLRLHSNSTELMLQYRQDLNGDVIVDTSKMFGKALKGGPNDSVESLKELLRQGKVSMALALDNNSAQDGSQFNPILLKIQEDGTIRIPKKLAEVFYGFDEKGKLLKSSGDHPGLHSLIFDTGTRRQKDGAMIVEEISATLGEKPEMKITENVTEEFPIQSLNSERIVPTPGEKTIENAAVQGGREFDYPWGGGPAGASRWQLEGERKQEKNPEEEEIIELTDVAEDPMIEGRKDIARTAEGRKFQENSKQQSEIAIESVGDTRENIGEEDNKSEFAIDDEVGRQSWERRYSNYFAGTENLEKISLNFKKLSARKALLERLESLERFEKLKGVDISSSNGVRREFLNYFDSFKKTYPSLSISFAEFNYCLKKALSDLKKFEQ